MVGQCEGGESRATAESGFLDALNLHTRVKVGCGGGVCVCVCVCVVMVVVVVGKA